MEIAPLALVVLLGYGLLIAVSLTTWTAFAYYRDEQEPDAAEPEEKKSRPVKARQQLSNDDVRGARSRRARGRGLFQDESPVTAGGASAAAQGAALVADDSGATAADDTVRPAGSSEPKLHQRDSSVAEKRQPARRKRTASADRGSDSDEDAFERFLKARPDDFDIS